MFSDQKPPPSERMPPPQDPFASPESSRPSSLRPRTASRPPSEASSSASPSSPPPFPRSILISPSSPTTGTNTPRFSSTSSIPLRSSSSVAFAPSPSIIPAAALWRPQTQTQPKKLPRMRSHMLPADSLEVPKPWVAHPSARHTFSYYLTYLVIILGALGGAVQTYFSYRNVTLDRKDLCLVLHEDFADPSTVFWEGDPGGGEGKRGTFFREVNMDGFGNGEFSMATASSNNSFIQNGQLHIVPTLTSSSIGDAAVFGYDPTVYNITGCTFNITRPNNGHIIRNGQRVFDSEAYRRACSMVSNATAGTMINPVQSARLTTRYSASIRYGRVEVRAKMPDGDWMWPAIWMLPRDEVYGPWPMSGEIDIVESRGNGLRYTAHGANYVQGSLNWGPALGLNGVSKSYSWWTDKRKKYSEDFHTYALEWTEEFLRIYVDTRLHTLLDLRFNKPFFQRGEFPQVVFNGSDLVALQNPWINGTNATPFDQEFYLILNVAVGSTSGWFPEGEGEKPWLDHAQNPMLDFAKAQAKWYSTWPDTAERRGMVVSDRGLNIPGLPIRSASSVFKEYRFSARITHPSTFVRSDHAFRSLPVTLSLTIEAILLQSGLSLNSQDMSHRIDGDASTLLQILLISPYHNMLLPTRYG
ncbi:hypothetical protein DXG03_008569 [Asterophora parasitica]|uniref:GH16 domain-containing protein n=1 Tax=Asterophora parasitica TaxID=117018 RepID=A0A9P7G5E8_9AGAR|nr:hypothetical protein DXG03_008569 [Asterophora parasitica]